MAAAATPATPEPARVFTEDDFVHVVNAAGEVQKDTVPKSWIGTSLLPEGSKLAPAKAVKDAEDDSV